MRSISMLLHRVRCGLPITDEEDYALRVYFKECEEDNTIVYVFGAFIILLCLLPFLYL